MRDETTSGNKPRLVTTLRKFLAAARLNPPSDESKTDSRTMMLVLHALAWHAKGVKEDAKTIESDASLKQVAELAHVSPRACQYAVRELERQKTIEVRRRGHHTSNVFTIHRSPILDMQPDCTSDPTSSGQNRPATEQFRAAADPPQTCNEAIQPCNMVASSGVDLQVLKNSGEDLQGKATSKSKPSPFSLKSQSQSQNPRTPKSEAAEIRDIESFLLEIGYSASWDNIKSIISELAAVSTKRQITRADALEEFKSRIRSMIKMPQPKRQSQAEREYARQLAREEEEESAQYDEDEYSEEEPVF